MEIVRAWDKFEDLSRARHTRGTMKWKRGLGDRPVAEGDELSPHESVGFVSVGDGENGVAMSIGVDSFGTVRRLLVSDGASVRPGQPLMEFEPRPPTTEEWKAERERVFALEHKLGDRERELENPARAAWASLRRRFGPR